MLENAQLTPPSDDGGVLIAPDPIECAAAARANHQALHDSKIPVWNSTLGEYRRAVRLAVAGADDRFVIVTGHQPGFMHAGVWAKHVVTTRLAVALDGLSINLIVDSDAAQQTTLVIPAVQEDDVALRRIPFADVPTDHAYEQIQAANAAQAGGFAAAVREAMGSRCDSSLMPTFLGALFATTFRTDDWVDQIVEARSAIEATFAMRMANVRVSRVWWAPLFADMLAHAERFVSSYNRALAWYRRTYRVRGVGRPLPDLIRRGNALELPVWAYRAGEPRRRVFASEMGDSWSLWADDVEVGVASRAHLTAWVARSTGGFEWEGWRLRPRVLALTLWARLLLADMFVHGIGGAQYDRITDAIIQDYYGCPPPRMACVSATLLMDLPRTETTPEKVRRLRYRLRDLEWNPQRHSAIADEAGALIDRRRLAVGRAVSLREREPGHRLARRRLFDEIRAINAELLAAFPFARDGLQAELAVAVEDLARDRLTSGREYFFGLHSRAALQRLLDALPAVSAFRV